MSNLKHGFYSKNESINPDSVLLSNAKVKHLLKVHHHDIVDVVLGKIVKPGVCDLVVYLIDCAMPNHKELLPQKYLEEIGQYYQSQVFQSLRKYRGNKTLDDLVSFVNSFS